MQLYMPCERHAPHPSPVLPLSEGNTGLHENENSSSSDPCRDMSGRYATSTKSLRAGFLNAEWMVRMGGEGG